MLLAGKLRRRHRPLQKSALSAMEADFDARTERLQAALQEAATARSSVDALQAEVGKANSEAQAAQKVCIPSRARWMDSCSTAFYTPQSSSCATSLNYRL